MSRQGFQGSVTIESFLSRPTDKAYAHDRTLETRTICLGTRMSLRTSDGAACAIELTVQIACMRDKYFVATDLSSSQ